MDKPKELRIEYLPVGDLIPYEKNPRKNDGAVKGVAESIREFGFKNPIIIDRKNMVVCGHTRLKAALKLGMAVVPCVRADDLTDEQVKAYRLADNKTGEAATWDLPLLELELADITSISMELFGFELPDPTGIVTEDEFDETLPEHPITQPGQIWQLGRHKLLCGDSTDRASVAMFMGDERADLYLTDPPYNVDYVGKTHDALKIENDDMTDDAYSEFLVKAFKAARAIMYKGAAFYIWHADSKGHEVRQACHTSGWRVRQCLIWMKNSMVMGRQDYQWKHEPCLYGWEPGAAHTWKSDRKQTTILEFDRPTRSPEHPTMKPVLMFAYQIQNSTDRDAIVYDGFAGSGTTIVACEQCGRTARCIDNDPRYCDVILRRYKTLTGIEPILLSV